MRIEFLRKIEEAIKAEEKAMLYTAASDDLGNRDLDLFPGDKVLILGDSVYYSRDLDEAVKDSLSSSLAENQPEEDKLIDIDVQDLDLEFFAEELIKKPRLCIFGAGHVSAPLANIADMLGFEVYVIDPRKDLMNHQRFPDNTRLISSSYGEFLQGYSGGKNDYIVIVTPEHEKDYEVLKGVIRESWKYLGMIGSRRKVGIIFQELQEELDIDEKILNGVDAPIGIEIGSETPEEIAVSIAGALTAVRRCT
ncbi:XdhC family protein [Halarsenatibacter silvermanii]|uniref:Xanthine dehydrogenase accessory factor n=1 Tax=Halarsenatibacter silvermanii TaxID=321763 RepID=A0A1G9I7X0_9FIRM|nr:XdhC family protein [Halarsenatibacter silvermanii]SDL21328.1 xanthine dehydrogenase accessory factor [Halarsenatibacter silvermanii]